MTASHVRPGIDAAHVRHPYVLWLLAMTGCAAAAAAVALAMASDHLPDPGLRAALLDWITVPYVLAGLVAWWRRPESRLGPLRRYGLPALRAAQPLDPS